MKATQTETINVTDFILDEKDPDRVALRLVDRAYSYGDLRAAANCVAGYLADLGCRRGDRAILLSENSFFWVAAYLGILRAGLVCVPLPSSVSAQDLEYVFLTTEACVAFVQKGLTLKRATQFCGIHLMTDHKIPSLSRIRSQSSLAEELHNSSLRTVEISETNANDLAALMFTSGSTGRPRGVMVSHGNIIANTESIIQYLELTQNDRVMTVLPFHYCFGASLLHTHLRVGANLVIDSRFMYPEIILQRMIDTECTGFAGVPSHFQLLLRTSSLRKKQFPSLRYIQQAGGHLAPAFIRELQSSLPEAQIFIQYGQTEATARLSYLPPELLDKKFGSIGKGIPNVSLRVLKESGLEVEPGEVGEIVAKGPSITHGYWKAPEGTASPFRNGELYTGDLATVDEDGFIYVVDRVSDFLKCGGKRVSCQQIEDQLLQCDELLEVAVIGIADEVLGEAVKAFVVPRTPDRSELKEFLQTLCKQQLPSQLVPKEFVVLRALPKNSAGKVLRHSLKAL